MPPLILSNSLLTRVVPTTTRLYRGSRWLTQSIRATSQEAVQETILKPSLLDIRVGKVLTCERHPDADALYVETVDVGEPQPRTICSGLVPYLTAEALIDAAVVVLCNLKPRNLRGIKSHGMLLCASDKDNNRVMPLVPPEGTTPGDRAKVTGYEEETTATENQVKKQKIWEKLQPSMKTNAEGVAQFQGKDIEVASGKITCEALPNAPIS